MRQPRLLVLGVTGMLGHKMFQHLSGRFSDVLGVSRDLTTMPRFRNVELLQDSRILQGFDAKDWHGLHRLLDFLRPDYVINCMGIVKQCPEAQDAIPSLLINSLLPHRLAEAAAQWGGRLIHFSTDCVFSGRRGGYLEQDQGDAEDLYGRSKFLGEVSHSGALTLRTSIVGRELANFRSLLEWFFAQRGKTIHGYKRSVYSGVTTNYLSDLIGHLIESGSPPSGLYQVAAEPISKYELLCLVRQVFDLDIDIRPVDGSICDRTLCADRFVAATGHSCPDWPTLIQDVYQDPTPYAKWKRQHDGTPVETV